MPAKQVAAAGSGLVRGRQLLRHVAACSGGRLALCQLSLQLLQRHGLHRTRLGSSGRRGRGRCGRGRCGRSGGSRRCRRRCSSWCGRRGRRAAPGGGRCLCPLPLNLWIDGCSCGSVGGPWPGSRHAVCQLRERCAVGAARGGGAGCGHRRPRQLLLDFVDANLLQTHVGWWGCQGISSTCGGAPPDGHASWISWMPTSWGARALLVMPSASSLRQAQSRTAACLAQQPPGAPPPAASTNHARPLPERSSQPTFSSVLFSS